MYIRCAGQQLITFLLLYSPPLDTIKQQSEMQNFCDLLKFSVLDICGVYECTLGG